MIFEIRPLIPILVSSQTTIEFINEVLGVLWRNHDGLIFELQYDGILPVGDERSELAGFLASKPAVHREQPVIAYSFERSLTGVRIGDGGSEAAQIYDRFPETASDEHLLVSQVKSADGEQGGSRKNCENNDCGKKAKDKGIFFISQNQRKNEGKHQPEAKNQSGNEPDTFPPWCAVVLRVHLVTYFCEPNIRAL